MSDPAASGTEDADNDKAADDPPTRYGVPFTDARGQLVLYPSVDTYVATIAALQADGFVSVVDLCAVDYLVHPARSLPFGIVAERFEVVVNLISHNPPRRARVRLQVGAGDPTVPTLFDLAPGTENMEREAFDMFGIVFTDHPDPTRILMPHDWDGHPLRKDFGVGAVPVQFKGAPAPR
jgi:NADH-quinone oxidoreductase subunit C